MSQPFGRDANADGLPDSERAAPSPSPKIRPEDASLGDDSNIRSEAGRTLLTIADAKGPPEAIPVSLAAIIRHAIPAIEAEATAPLLARIAALEKALRDILTSDEYQKMEAEGKAADLLGLVWQWNSDHFVDPSQPVEP